MSDINKNPYFIIAKNLPRNLYRRLINTFIVMFIAGFLEFFTLIISYPFFAIISGQVIKENSNEEKIFSLIPFLNESNIMFLFVATIIILSFVRVYNLRTITYTNSLIVNKISKNVFENIIQKDYELLTSLSTSDLTNKLQIHINLMGFCLSLTLQFFSAFITSLLIIFGLTQLAFYEMISILSGFTLFYFFIGSKLKNSLSKNSTNLTKSSKNRMKTIRDTFALIKDIKLSNISKSIINEYAKDDYLERRSINNNVYLSGYPRFVLEGFGYVLIISIAILISISNGNQNSLAKIALLALGMQRLLPSMQMIYSSWSNFEGNRKSFKIVADLLDSNKSNISKKKNINFESILKLEKVNFGYSNSKDLILKDITFEIKKGEFIGIIGESGSGKSTLMDIMMGLLKPSGGKFFFDDKEINIYNWNDYKESIRILSGHVPQEVFLFNETIFSNISKFDDQKPPSISDAINSSKLANINNFIQSLPNGYNYLLRDNGSNLSGGQKQRIGISRALYKKPKILYLDESTSGLDPKSEHAFVENLKSLKGKMTIVFISHRIQSLRNCDRIFEINNGYISDKTQSKNK